MLNCSAMMGFGQKSQQGEVFVKYRGNHCRVEKLSDIPYMAFDNPFIYWLVKNQAWVLIAVILFSFRHYMKIGGFRLLKEDYQRTKRYIQEKIGKDDI